MEKTAVLTSLTHWISINEISKHKYRPRQSIKISPYYTVVTKPFHFRGFALYNWLKGIIRSPLCKVLGIAHIAKNANGEKPCCHEVPHHSIVPHNLRHIQLSIDCWYRMTNALLSSSGTLCFQITRLRASVHNPQNHPVSDMLIWRWFY